MKQKTKKKRLEAKRKEFDNMKISIGYKRPGSLKKP